jgi:Kdo2-lipid IVA lauroyltransferase/acyltransferase
MRIKHRLEYFAFTSFVGLFRILGLNGTRKSADYLGCVLYYLIPIRKKVVIENIRIAFPQKSEKEIKKIALRNYQNILITFFEMMLLPYLSPEESVSSVVSINQNCLAEKIEKKQPVIILTGHFGGWEFCFSTLTIKIGEPFHLLAQAQSNPLVSNYVIKARDTFGNKTILAGISIRQLYQTLKSGGVVGIAGDQRGEYGGPRFNFFNKPTALHTGTASIALKTNSSIILAACERQKDRSYKIYFEELSFENLPEGEEEKLKELTQRYISFLEKYIRKNPEQYFWMHKLWKY